MAAKTPIISRIVIEGDLFVMDGADHAESKKTKFTGGEAVKLSEFLDRYACEGKEVQQYGQPIKGLKIKNVVIYDKKDMGELERYRELKLDLSESIVAQEAVSELGTYLGELRARNYKVLEGSKIKFPQWVGGLATFDDLENAKKVCLEIGFQLV
jgi:hypothetical protein